MKLNKLAKIEAVCESASKGYPLEHVLLDGDKVIGCNGKALVALTVEREDGDTDGLIPVSAIKAARKLATRHNPLAISANGSVALADGTSMPRPEGQYPEWRKVIPDNTGKKTLKIGLDANLLASISDALTNNGMTQYISLEINLDATTSPIIIRRSTESAPDSDFGVIMPVRLG